MRGREKPREEAGKGMMDTRGRERDRGERKRGRRERWREKRKR